MYLKQQNRESEIKLQKNADTWAALANIVGLEFPEGLLKLAWKYQLANQSHDSIAGCSVDTVHEDVEYRNRQIRHLADNVSRLSMAHLVTQIDNSRLPKDAVCLIAFNPTQYQRTEVVSVALDLPEEAGADWFTLEDENGKELPVQFIRDYPFGPIVKNPYEFPIPYKARRFHCFVELEQVPGLGYKTFLAQAKSGQKVNYGSLSPDVNILENQYLRAEILPDGRITLLNKQTGKEYPGVHYFEDRSEVGDHATRRPADKDEIITSIGAATEIAKICDGPLLVQYRLKTTMMLPKDALKDRSRRNPEKIPFEIYTTIILRKESRFLEFRTELDNQVRDHKLRVMFPSGCRKAKKSFSETHFDVTERDIHLPDTSTWKEPMLPYYPQYMFCGVQADDAGLAVLNIGLPEYAVHEDEKRTIGLTLLRTYRFPIIGANPEDVPTDETQVMCQCLRSFVFEYALYPYQGDWNRGEVISQARRFNLKLRLNQTGRSTGALPATNSFIQIEPNELVLSAVKKSSRNDALLVRFYNPTEETVTGSIKFWRLIKKACFVNLNEKFISKADFTGNVVQIVASKNKIVTLEVVLAD